MRRSTISKAIDEAVHHHWCGEDTKDCDRHCEGRLDMAVLSAATDAVMAALKSEQAGDDRG